MSIVLFLQKLYKHSRKILHPSLVCDIKQTRQPGTQIQLVISNTEDLFFYLLCPLSDAFFGG